MTFIEKFALKLTIIMCLGLGGYALLEHQPSEDFVVTVERSRTDIIEEVAEEEPEEEILVISPESPLNINRATLEELDLLPNIGEKRASDIISFRDEHGDFVTIEDIMLVSGIGEGIFEDLKDIITIEATFSEELPPEEVILDENPTPSEAESA